jgi:hypothetical protein
VLRGEAGKLARFFRYWGVALALTLYPYWGDRLVVVSANENMTATRSEKMLIGETVERTTEARYFCGEVFCHDATGSGKS